MDNLNKKIASGFLWSTVQLGINKGFAFVVKIVLAKLLFPEDFGIVGMAAVFISFIQVLNDLGFGVALIQKKKETLTETHYHTAFWTGIAWSVFIYLIIFFIISNFAASFYNEPILEEIIPVLSLSVLSSPVNLVHNAQLTKAMNFKRLAIINNTSSIFSGLLSIVLALYGAGVWSLVFNSVAGFFITMPLLFNATKWMPRFVFSKEAFNDIFGFGVYTTGTKIFYNLIDKLDYLLIGKFLSASSLGVYTLAYVLTDTFRSQIMTVTGKVMFPAYSHIQENTSLVKKYYKEVVRLNCVVIFPIMTAFIVIGKDFIIKVFGERWSESGLVLQILSAAVMVHLLVNSWGAVLRGLGKPKLEFNIQLFRGLFIYTPIMFIGVYYFGMEGAAVAFLINKIFMFFIAQYYLRVLIDLRLGELLLFIKTPLLLSALGLAVGFILKFLGVHYIVILAIVEGLYIGGIYFLLKEDLLKLKNLRKKKVNYS